jgi:hypothetical protein
MSNGNILAVIYPYRIKVVRVITLVSVALQGVHQGVVITANLSWTRNGRNRTWVKCHVIATGQSFVLNWSQEMTNGITFFSQKCMNIYFKKNQTRSIVFQCIVGLKKKRTLTNINQNLLHQKNKNHKKRVKAISSL